METKNKIGALVVLGGIALLGLYWFKKNKPTTSSSQAKGLQALSNYYQTGSGGFEETFIPNSGIKRKCPYGMMMHKGICQSILTNLDYTNLSPKELEDLKKAIGTIPDPSNMVSNQIAQNMQNADFSNLSNLGITGVTFNVPKK